MKEIIVKSIPIIGAPIFFEKKLERSEKMKEMRIPLNAYIPIIGAPVLFQKKRRRRERERERN